VDASTAVGVSIVLSLMGACACTGDDTDGLAEDGTEVDTGTDDESDTSDTSGAETGADPYAECDAYCAVWLDCTDAYAGMSMCMTACAESIDNAALGGTECFLATEDLFACIGMLDCAQLATLDMPDGACEAEDGAVMSACA
jgi:hypothetical protein